MCVIIRAVKLLVVLLFLVCVCFVAQNVIRYAPEELQTWYNKQYESLQSSMNNNNNNNIMVMVIMIEINLIRKV